MTTTLQDVTTAADTYANTVAAAAVAKVQADDLTARTAMQVTIDSLTTKVTALTDHDAVDEQTIATLRAELAKLQVQTARFPGDPGIGNMYVGTSENGGDPSTREKVWGAKVGAYRSYFQWDQEELIAARATRDLAAGRLPIISFKDAGRWATIASGADDVIVGQLMTALAAVKGPVWLCMHHEPVDDTATEGTAADFAAANKRLMTMIPPNVALVPILQSAPFDPTVKGNPAGLNAWLPDGSYTFPGFDTYNHRFYKPTPGNVYRDAKTCLSFVDVMRQQLGKPDLPIAIAEFGVRTDPASDGKAAGWLRDFVAQAATMNIPAVTYFDSGLNVNDMHGITPVTPWTLDGTDGTDTERLNAYGPLVAAGAHLVTA